MVARRAAISANISNTSMLAHSLNPMEAPDISSAVSVPCAAYFVPGNVEDNKEEWADEIYQECRHYSYPINTGRSQSITTTLSFRSVHTHNTGYIQTENSIHGIRTLRTNIPGNQLRTGNGLGYVSKVPLLYFAGPSLRCLGPSTPSLCRGVWGSGP